MLTEIDAKELVRRIFEEAVNQAQTDVIGELYADDFIDHSPGPDQAPGPAGIVDVVKQYRTAIPDLSVTVEDVIVAGDRVITRETWRGTHRHRLGDFLPTNASFVATRIHILRIENGRVAEEWTAGSIIDRLRALSTAEENTWNF
ncbi:MAG TPA: ester cyclase [Anaerolineales bacterium]|nr:ester cyclase [Anaerolineales bacterium]